MEGVFRFRVATYNIHKCRGFDRRTSPDRINAVIEELQAEIVCLQEVVDAPEGPRIFDQAREIAKPFPAYSWRFGSNRALRGGQYGNMTLTRFPIRSWRNHDLTHGKREERGVLQVEIDLGGNQALHIFNIHLGTSYTERRSQAARLLSPAVLGQEGQDIISSGDKVSDDAVRARFVASYDAKHSIAMEGDSKATLVIRVTVPMINAAIADMEANQTHSFRSEIWRELKEWLLQNVFHKKCGCAVTDMVKSVSVSNRARASWSLGQQ